MKCLLFLLIVLVSVGGCSKQSTEITGKWRLIDTHNRNGTIDFHAGGKVCVNSSELLDWDLIGREMSIAHPEAPTMPIRMLVSFPDGQHLDLVVLDDQTGRRISRRRFERIIPKSVTQTACNPLGLP